ncbi:MAG: HAD family phosphatase [Myxococcota bacterium]|nr:HAD family phosphatase [Myxococcota bacterium]
MAVEAVIWDFGGVFIGSPFAAMAEVARDLDVDPKQYFGAVFGPYDRDTDHPWHRLERGEITLVAAREEILELGRAEGFDADPFHFFGAMARNGGGGARSEVVECARELKAGGMPTALLTNNAVEFREAWTRTVPVDELFHHIIDSSEVGMRKPDPRIFELTLERLGGIAAGNAVFLDDYPGNIEAAERVGIRGVLVTEDYAAALGTLRALLDAQAG